MIVEDNMDHAELLSEIMSVLRVGYKISYAENGQQALHKLENKLQADNERLPDVIFIDIKMPVMNGLATLKCIRNNPEFDDIKLVMVSTSTIESEVENGLQAGACAYLTKPVEPETLIETFQSVELSWSTISTN
jgi:CheY-like chemotaxis protein